MQMASFPLVEHCEVFARGPVQHDDTVRFDSIFPIFFPRAFSYRGSYLFIRTEELRATVCALRVLLGGVLGAVYIGPLSTKHLFGMQRCYFGIYAGAFFVGVR